VTYFWIYFICRFQKFENFSFVNEKFKFWKWCLPATPARSFWG